MTEALYLKDHYLKEFEATVLKVEGNFIILNKSGFYPSSGGQLHDTGKLIKDNQIFNVIFVKKLSQDISHEVDKPGLKPGDKVKGIIDWERRYKLMKAHTSAHIVSEIIHRNTGALITGNQLDLDKIRIDFSLENFDKEKFKHYIEEANQIIQQDLPITISFATRQDAFKIPQVSKLAKGLPDFIENIRLVKIGDFDIQADGGTHVNSTKEIGTLEFINAENKGKNNRRLYYKIKDE